MGRSAFGPPAGGLILIEPVLSRPAGDVADQSICWFARPAEGVNATSPVPWSGRSRIVSWNLAPFHVLQK